MTAVRKKILLTNDDGIRSSGVIELYKELSRFADVTVITPHIQRSGEGKAITINNIVRVEKVDVNGLFSGYTITGTSADAIIFGVGALEEGPFDFVVSGINQGLNISSHIILTSGTCAAAFEAAYYGLPAIAFSLNVSQKHYFVSPDSNTFEQAAKVSAKIVKELLERDFPEKLAFLNVNYPDNVAYNTPIVYTFLADRFLDFTPKEQKDPRGMDYYFFWGGLTKEIPEGSDLEIIMKEKVSISAVRKNLTLENDNSAKEFVEDLLEKLE